MDNIDELAKVVNKIESIGHKDRSAILNAALRVLNALLYDDESVANIQRALITHDGIPDIATLVYSLKVTGRPLETTAAKAITGLLRKVRRNPHNPKAGTSERRKARKMASDVLDRIERAERTTKLRNVLVAAADVIVSLLERKPIDYVLATYGYTDVGTLERALQTDGTKLCLSAAEAINALTNRKPVMEGDQPDYEYYIVDASGKPVSGWSYRIDANDALDDYPNGGEGYSVVHRRLIKG